MTGSAPTHNSFRADDGFTLPELLVAIVVLALLIGALATAVISSLQSESGISGRLSDSSAAQLTSAYYVRDVQSSAFVTSDALATSPVPCGTGTPAAAGLTFQLAMSWGSPTAGGTIVSYWTNSTGSLVRLYCSHSSNTPTSTVSLSLSLAPSYGLTTVITPSVYATKAASGWVSTIGISGVSLTTLQTASQYRVELLGVPRVTAPTGNGGNPQPPPFLLLGTGTDVLGCSGSNGTININGTAYIDSTANAAGQLGNSTFTATQIYTAGNPSTSITTGPNGSYSPQPPTAGPVIADPYAGLTPPSPVGLPQNPATTTAGNTVYYSPGVYTSQVQLSGNKNVVFNSGVYILQQGLSVTGTGTVTSGGGGVFFYVTGGSISLGGGGNITLTPIASPPNPASDLVIWQDKSDTNQISLAGNGGVHTISGIIYAPTAIAGGGGNGSYVVGSMVTSGFACNGNGAATIG